MPDNVIPLRGVDTTPQMVIDTIERRIDDIEDIVVITVNRDPKEAGFSVYCSGNISVLPYASHILHDFATKYVKGEVRHIE